MLLGMDWGICVGGLSIISPVGPSRVAESGS